MWEYIDKKVGRDINDTWSLQDSVNKKFKEIDNKNIRNDQEILKAWRNICYQLQKELTNKDTTINGQKIVYWKWALEPLNNLIIDLKKRHNNLINKNEIKDKKKLIDQVANKIDNAEKETLLRLARNRTTQNSRNIVNKWNEAHKDKPMFVMEWWNDYRKQTWNIIFTKESNPVKIHEALKWLFTNPNIVYEIDYSGCDTSTPKWKAIKEKMTWLIWTQTCYLRYDKDQKTYTIRDKYGNWISDRAYIRQWVKLIPAWVRARQAYTEQKSQNENLWKLNNNQLGFLTKAMLKDIPSAKDLTAEEQKDLVTKTENRITELLKKAKSLWYDLESECISKKHFWYWHMELHLNSGSSETDRTVRGNDGSYNKILWKKLDNFIDSNEWEYKTYLTNRVKAKWQELDSLTKTESINLNKKWQKNLTDKEKELAKSHKQQVLYGIWLFEKMVNNYAESEWDSWDNDDRDLVQIKKLIRNAKSSINDSDNLDDNAIINNFINPIWVKRASIKRITKTINNWQGQIFDNPAYKEQYNQLKNVFLWDKNKQISAIRSLWWHGRLFDKTETSFLAEEIEWNEDLTVKNADIKECIKNIKTRLPDSIFDKNWNIIQKRKEQFDKLFTAAAKWTDSLISLLVNSKMLPANRKDEESEVRNCVENLKNQLNTIDKQSEIPNITESIKQKEKAEKLRLEQKSNKTEEEMQRLQALTFLEEHSEQRDTINKEIIERTRLEIRYLSLWDTVKSCLFPALAELWGWAEWKNSDIYNDIKWYWTWNLSDENAKKWSEEIIEDIIIEVAIAAVSIALAPTGAWEAIYLSFRVAKASAKWIKWLNKLRKSMWVFTKTFGKKMATQYAWKFSVKSAKAAKKITKVSHIATSTEKWIKWLNIVKRTKDAYQTIKATETFWSLAGKLAMKWWSMVIEWVGFHLNSTVIHNAIEWKNLSEWINPFWYTEWPNGEKISNFRNYAQSIAFLWVLKTIWKPIQWLTWNMAKWIFWKYYDANWLTKMAKNIVSMTWEMGSMMWTDQILSLTFDQKFKPVTAEDLVSMFWMVAWLRLTNKVYLKIQEYDWKSVTVEMKQWDNTFNVKIDREWNVIKVEWKDKDWNKIQNPQEALGIKSWVEWQNLRETHNWKEVWTVKWNLRQLNNLHEGDIITVKHWENNVRFKKNKDWNREVIDAENIENDRFKPWEEYIAKENQDWSWYHLETKAQWWPKISLDWKVWVKLRSSELETEKKSQESEEKSEDEIKKTGEELEDIKERASKIRTKIKEIEKQISEIENSREISNRKTLAHNIYERRTGKKSSISINKYYEWKILKSWIQIIDTRTWKKTTIKFDAQKKINDLWGNTQELAKLDIEIAERMILGIKNGHIEVRNIEEAVKIKNWYPDMNLEIVGLENGNYGVRKKSNIRKLRQQKAELEWQLKWLKSEHKKKTTELNKEKKFKDIARKEENAKEPKEPEKKPEEPEVKKPENIEKELDELLSKTNKWNYENIKLDWVTKTQFETWVFIEWVHRRFKNLSLKPNIKMSKEFLKKMRDGLVDMKNKWWEGISEYRKQLVDKWNKFFEKKLAEKWNEVEIKSEEINSIEWQQNNFQWWEIPNFNSENWKFELNYIEKINNWTLKIKENWRNIWEANFSVKENCVYIDGLISSKKGSGTQLMQKLVEISESLWKWWHIELTASPYIDAGGWQKSYREWKTNLWFYYKLWFEAKNPEIHQQIQEYINRWEDVPLKLNMMTEVYLTEKWIKDLKNNKKSHGLYERREREEQQRRQREEQERKQREEQEMRDNIIKDTDSSQEIADKLENSIENNTNFEVGKEAFVSWKFIEWIKNWFNKIIQKPDISLPKDSIKRLKNKISEMMKNRGNELSDGYKRLVERFDRYLNDLLKQPWEKIKIMRQERRVQKEQLRREREEQPRREREKQSRILNQNEKPERWINTERREMSEVHRNSDVIAIWDLHWEYIALKWDMEYAWLAREVNWHLDWTGWNKKVVFQWDILGDRWTDWLRIIKEIHQLREQARKQWWDVDIIVGNHDDFMISYLLWLKWERFLWHRVLDVIDYKQRKWLNELAKFIWKDIRDSENLYGTGTREAILQAMRNSQEWRLILEEICNMKLVSQVDDVLYCHTNPTAKMLEYLTKWNVQQNINLLNQKYQWYLRKTLLWEWNWSITLEEFNQISDTFLNTNNRPKYGSEIWLENYTEALKNNWINMISHGHNWWREYHTKQIWWIKIVDTDYSYWHSWNYTWEHSVSVIKKEWWVNYMWDNVAYTNLDYPIWTEVLFVNNLGQESKVKVEAYNPATKEYTISDEEQWISREVTAESLKMTT